jgi:hypothetical protein
LKENEKLYINNYLNTLNNGEKQNQRFFNKKQNKPNNIYNISDLSLDGLLDNDFNR